MRWQVLKRVWLLMNINRWPMPLIKTWWCEGLCGWLRGMRPPELTVINTIIINHHHHNHHKAPSSSSLFTIIVTIIMSRVTWSWGLPRIEPSTSLYCGGGLWRRWWWWWWWQCGDDNVVVSVTNRTWWWPEEDLLAQVRKTNHKSQCCSLAIYA